MKKYLAVWGNWDKSAPNSYDPAHKEVYSNEIVENKGYSDNEFFGVQQLEVGDKWESELGNHLIVRLA